VPNFHDFYVKTAQILQSNQNMWNVITFHYLPSSRCLDGLSCIAILITTIYELACIVIICIGKSKKNYTKANRKKHIVKKKGLLEI
jgi:hypothetical protein